MSSNGSSSSNSNVSPFFVKKFEVGTFLSIASTVEITTRGSPFKIL